MPAPLTDTGWLDAADVDVWSKREWSNGLQIDSLQDLDMLSVRTRNSTYEITVVNAGAGEVLVRGGHLFPERTAVRLSGSSLGGTFLKRHGIYIGFSMELHVADRTILTSEVQSIGRVRAMGAVIGASAGAIDPSGVH
jgi:hypothetical protein